MATLKDQIQVALSAAEIAEANFEKAVHTAGFKSRWDVTGDNMKVNPLVLRAYQAKVQADQAMSDAFARARDE